jgi:hypothetical protein
MDRGRDHAEPSSVGNPALIFYPHVNLWGRAMRRASLIVLAVFGLLSGTMSNPARAESALRADSVAQSPTAEPANRKGAGRDLPSQPAAGANKAGDAAGTSTPPVKDVAPLPPIVFFVATGGPNACGLGCREWIAAVGTIDIGAEDRLRALLKKLGGRKLPIFFHSPGGSVPSGLAIGRLMRQHGLTAGVARTVPVGCDPQQAREAACDKLMRSGRELPAEIDGGHVMCNSSCVYALVGAAVREVGAGVKLGIHSTSISFLLKRVDAQGHVTRMSTHVAPAVERGALQSGNERIAAYLHDMGIAPGLLAAAREISSDRVRFLTRDEVVAFGIDRRELVEGAWWFVDETPAAAVKIIEAKAPDAGSFRKIILRLACKNSLSLQFQYGREVEKAGGPARLRVTAGAGSFALGSGVTVAQSGNPLPLEVRSAELPTTVLGDAAFVIEAAESRAAGPAATDGGFVKVTAQNVGPGLGTLAHHCGTLPMSAPGRKSGGT